MDIQQARTRLIDVSDQAHKIYNTAKEQGRDLELSEAKELDRLLDEADDLRRQIQLGDINDWMDQPTKPRIPPQQPGAMMPSGSTEYYFEETRWHTKDDRAIPIFSKGDRLTNHYRNDDGLTFGGLLKAMVTGGGSSRYRDTLQEGTDSLGGLTVAGPLLAQVIDALRARSVLFQAGAQILSLPQGNPVQVAKLTSDPSVAWHQESVSISASTPTFGAVNFTPRTLVSLVKMSRELAEDSLNAETALMQAFAASLALEVDRVGILGSGAAGEPTGILNTTNIGDYDMGTNGSALSDYSPIIQAFYELEIDNSPVPTGILMHPRTKKELSVLQDTTNQPMMPPPALDGIPILTTTAIPIDDTQGTSTDASRIYVGHFPNLIWGSVHELRIETLSEKYSDTYEIAWLAHLRGDWVVRHPESFCTVTGVVPV